MSRFYVGQRVRIVRRESPFHGKEATIVGRIFARHRQFGIGYFYAVDVDGIGRIGRVSGLPVSYRGQDLQPLVPPHEACETEFKSSLDELLARQEVPA